MNEFKELCNEIDGILVEHIYDDYVDITCKIDDKDGIEKLKMIDSELKSNNEIKKELKNFGIDSFDYKTDEYSIYLSETGKEYYGEVIRDIKDNELYDIEKNIFRTINFKNFDADEMETFGKIELAGEIMKKIDKKFGIESLCSAHVWLPTEIYISCYLNAHSNEMSFNDFLKKVNEVQEYLDSDEIINIVEEVAQKYFMEKT